MIPRKERTPASRDFIGYIPRKRANSLQGLKIGMEGVQLIARTSLS
jgi:hypothetical protein